MRERLTLSAKEQQRSEVVGRWLAGILTTSEATLLLGCSERTAWRLRAAMLRGGAAGLAHGNRGRPSARRLPDEVADRIVCVLEGRVVASGRPSEMTREEVMDHYFGHRRNAPAGEHA